MAEYKSLGVAKHRKPSDELKAKHRKKLAAYVWTVRRSGKFKETQDYRTAKAYAGVPITCAAYLDRLELSVEDNAVIR